MRTIEQISWTPWFQWNENKDEGFVRYGTLTFSISCAHNGKKRPNKKVSDQKEIEGLLSLVECLRRDADSIEREIKEKTC